MDNDREYHDEFSGYKWTPPNPNEIKIKYSKISEAHRQHLERKKRGNWRNGKKAKPRTQNVKRRERKEKQAGRMAKKRNQKHRTLRDGRARKSMQDGKKWTERLLEDLHAGVEPEESPIKRRKGRRNRETASRLTNDSL